LAPFSSISPVLRTSSFPSWRLCAPFTVSSAEKTYSSHDAFLPLPDSENDFAFTVFTFGRNPFPLYDGIYIISGRVVQARSALSSKSSVAPVLHVNLLSLAQAFVLLPSSLLPVEWHQIDVSQYSAENQQVIHVRCQYPE
ncbi:hypothetical protein V8E55_006597, partial [Tylopilus felleus]